jgi:hypothetical protein
MAHYQGKLAGGYSPVPPPTIKAPKWEIEYLAAMVQHGKHLRIVANILNQSAKVMIDSGATGNFMNPAFMKKLGILGKIKAVPEPIAGLNRENLGTLSITTESGPVLMVMIGHLECLNFDVMPIGWYDMVLGIPWLRNHNPAINWNTNQIQFNYKYPQQDRHQGETRALQHIRLKDSNNNAKQSKGGLRKATTS